MRASTPRYTTSLFFQIFSMVCDLLFNCLSLFPRSREGLLVIFVFQNLFLILSLFLMLMNLLSTYLFQAGLLEVLVRKFRAVVIVGLAYLTSNILLHTFWLYEKWDEHESISTPMLIFLFTVQRVLSPLYYFFYKRAALRVSDPRFYEDIDWMNRAMETR